MARRVRTQTSRSKRGGTGALLRFRSDNGLVLGLTRYNVRVDANLLSYMQDKAREAEAYMKANHPWTNRTYRAEKGLNAKAESTAPGQVSIVLAHGEDVWYAVYLEYGMGRRFAIIEPTQQTFGPRVINEINYQQLWFGTSNPKA